MITIPEGRLRFQFPDEWDAIKFDDTQWHKQKMKNKLHAMDILAIHQQQHWWIEIKDCESFETENRPRMSTTDPTEVLDTRNWVDTKGWKKKVNVTRRKQYIVDEILEKLRDTLFSLSIANRENDVEVSSFSKFVNPSLKITIVLVLTWNIIDFKRLAKLLHQKLSTALLPYGLQGFVVNELTPVPDLNCTITKIA